MKKRKVHDRAGLAMIVFGVGLCILSICFRQFWLIVPGIVWIAIPLFLTEEDDEDASE